MPEKTTTVQVFCQSKAENAGRPDEAGRLDLTFAVLRPNHLRAAGQDAPKDPNPGVFVTENSNGSFQFGDVTEEFAAQFKRGRKYEIVLREIE